MALRAGSRHYTPSAVMDLDLDESDAGARQATAASPTNSGSSRGSCNDDTARTLAVFLWRREYALRQRRPRAGYMDTVQARLPLAKRINAKHREILMDWHIEVADEFQASTESLHLAVALVDHVLSVVPTERCKLQLLGCVCMLLANKVEEPEPHDIDDFVYISDNTYSKKEFVQAEAMVLEALHYDLAVTTPFTLMQHLLEFSESELVEHLYAEFLLEVAGLDYQLSTTCDPLTLAAAVMHLTRHTLLYSQRVVLSLKAEAQGQSSSASSSSSTSGATGQSSANNAHAGLGTRGRARGGRGAKPFLPPGCDWLETALLHYGSETGATQGQVTAFVERYNATHGPNKAKHPSPSPIPFTV